MLFIPDPTIIGILVFSPYILLNVIMAESNSTVLQGAWSSFLKKDIASNNNLSVHGNLPVLITFIEVLGSRVPVIDEPETLNRESQVSYYGIRENDEAAFSKIIEAFIGNYFGV